MTMDEWLEANGIDPADVAVGHPPMIVSEDIIVYVREGLQGLEESTVWCSVRPPEELGIIEV